MEIDDEKLYRFEEGLDPRFPERSAVPVAIVGYGEISAIFQIDGDDEHVFKRLPLFDSRAAAEAYEQMYHEYSQLLQRAGIGLPAHATRVVSIPGRPVVLYIAQQKHHPRVFCHQLIHQLKTDESLAIIEQAVAETAKVWAFNRKESPQLTLAIDGQLSNWISPAGRAGGKMLYIDTSTPLFCKRGVEQQNPELMLQSAPGFLRWIIRLFFLSDVMTRYYHPRLVYTDIAANLYKEQKSELVGDTVDIINRHLPAGESPLTVKEVKNYYREDKWIWTLFLAFRRLDRWLKTACLRQRYEFILPGPIKR